MIDVLHVVIILQILKQQPHKFEVVLIGQSDLVIGNTGDLCRQEGISLTLQRLTQCAKDFGGADDLVCLVLTAEVIGTVVQCCHLVLLHVAGADHDHREIDLLPQFPQLLQLPLLSMQMLPMRSLRTSKL